MLCVGGNLIFPLFVIARVKFVTFVMSVTLSKSVVSVPVKLEYSVVTVTLEDWIIEYSAVSSANPSRVLLPDVELLVDVVSGSNPIIVPDRVRSVAEANAIASKNAIVRVVVCFIFFLLSFSSRIK